MCVCLNPSFPVSPPGVLLDIQQHFGVKDSGAGLLQTGKRLPPSFSCAIGMISASQGRSVLARVRGAGSVLNVN